MNEDTAIPGLRDFMAVSALSILSDKDVSMNFTASFIASKCYAIADAMLIEREKNAVSKV